MYNELIDIITTDIPEAKKREDSFLDIISQGHRENTISSIYAYFLDNDNDVDMASLFVSTLLELIQEKSGKDFKLSGYKCYTESSTKQGNRIDILMEDETDKKAIIIENKIYHALNNNLIDYWDFKDYAEQDKIGVILTLSPKWIPMEVRGKFINITHIEWINKIKSVGIPFNLTTNSYVYLTDFIKNIEQLSQQQKMNEQVKFFFKHADKVLKIIDVYDEAEKYVNNQLKIVAEKLGNGRTLGKGGNGYKTIWDDKSHVYYTIITSDLLSAQRSINIIIELYKDAIHKEEELKAMLSEDEKYMQLSKDGKKTPYWTHFAYKIYKLNDADTENMADCVYNIISQDFEPVFTRIITYLNAKNNVQ